MEPKYVLETKNICKDFPGVKANVDVDIHLKAGDILAILGENGAGKTTLLNIIYGLYSQDSGEIYLNGQLSPIKNPNDAIKAGIGMVHQHFMLVPVFSVLENIILGSEVLWGPFINKAKARKKIVELSNLYGLEVDPDTIIEDIPVGVQQRVEILKALYRHANILILDEPTAVLTPQETKDLFGIIRLLKEQGVSIVFISHKLKEVMEIADRIVVMRRGRIVGETLPSQTSEKELANMMVGREVLLQVDKGIAQPKQVVFEVDNLTVKGASQMHTVHNVSFKVRAGEILGLAGVQGNGQTELVEAITGLRKPDEGLILLDGNTMPFQHPRALVENGMAHIPEDRHKHGLVLPYELTDNFVLCTYYQEPFSKGSIRNEKAILENAVELIERFDVRTPSPHTISGNLSGGNQQKVIVGRELSRPVKILIANQPTRGLDVGSIEYIHKTLVKMRDQGVAVLLISAELDEIMGLSDRIAVMYRGQIVATVNASETTREEMGLLMAGLKKESGTPQQEPLAVVAKPNKEKPIIESITREEPRISKKPHIFAFFVRAEDREVAMMIDTSSDEKYYLKIQQAVGLPNAEVHLIREGEWKAPKIATVNDDASIFIKGIQAYFRSHNLPEMSNADFYRKHLGDIKSEVTGLVVVLIKHSPE